MRRHRRRPPQARGVWPSTPLRPIDIPLPGPLHASFVPVDPHVEIACISLMPQNGSYVEEEETRAGELRKVEREILDTVRAIAGSTLIPLQSHTVFVCHCIIIRPPRPRMIAAW